MSDTKLMPHSLESEKAVLGAVLLDERAIHTASDSLLEKDFYVEGHRRIFTSMLALTVDGVAIDAWTLSAEIDRRGWMESVGGKGYILSLTDGLPRALNLKHYCDIVREKAVARELIRAGQELMQRAFAQEEKPQTILESVQTALIALYGRNQRSGLRPMSDIVSEGYKDLEARSKKTPGVCGVMTGFADIDRMTGGFRPGNMVVLAAGPSRGKSALATNVAANAASRGKHVAIFSLEMGQTEIYDRMLAHEGRLNCHAISHGYVRRDDWRVIGEVSGQLSKYPAWIDDSGGLTMMQMRARCSKLAAEHGLDLVVVDYLQLVQGVGKSVYERVTGVSRELKILAKDLKVPVLVLSQLHRLATDTTEPHLHDLRDSGAVEQDADVVLFLWSDGSNEYRKAKIAKQRNGPVGAFDLGWTAEQTRFFDMAAQE